MSARIPNNHPRNFALFRESLKRRLQCRALATCAAEAHYAVSSWRSQPGAEHHVSLNDAGYICSCPSTTACSHGALALAQHNPTLGALWQGCIRAEAALLDTDGADLRERVFSLLARLAAVELLADTGADRPALTLARIRSLLALESQPQEAQRAA